MIENIESQKWFPHTHWQSDVLSSADEKIRAIDDFYKVMTEGNYEYVAKSEAEHELAHALADDGPGRFLIIVSGVIGNMSGRYETIGSRTTEELIKITTAPKEMSNGDKINLFFLEESLKETEKYRLIFFRKYYPNLLKKRKGKS